MYRVAQILSITLLISACSTPEYRRSYDQCSVQAFDRYPTKIQMIESECSREIEVDTGKTECITTYEEQSKRTVCGPLLEVVTETYQCEVERDVNRNARDIFTRQCAAQLCLSTYGNADCETD